MQDFRVFSFRRWSTKSQSDGTSGERQLSSAIAYCDAQGWTLDESLTDAGRSAYKGLHIHGGAFGRFLAQIKSGIVKAGDKLIFEGFDRFSRQPPDIALPIFFDIIKAGIEIHTIATKQVFNLDTIRNDQGQLYMTLSLMWSAHTESKNKAFRVKASWKRRRDAVTKVCPAWLRPTKNDGFDIVTEYVSIIARIFDMTIKGYAIDKICMILNQEGVAGFTKADGKANQTGWHPSYVRDIITSRRVLGFAEFYEWTVDDEGNEKRIDTGESKKIYPAVIDENIWLQAQANRKKGVQGRNAQKVGNIVGGQLCTCSCGSYMRLVTKGNENRHKYLQCENARRNAGCTQKKLHKYFPIERHILASIGSLAYGDPETSANPLDMQIQKAKSDAADLERRYNALSESMGIDIGPLGIKRLAALETAHSEAIKTLRQLESEAKQMTAAPLAGRLSETQTLIESMDKLTGDDLIAVRSRINTGLRNFIEGLKFNQPDSEWQIIWKSGLDLRNKGAGGAFATFNSRIQDGSKDVFEGLNVKQLNDAVKSVIAANFKPR